MKKTEQNEEIIPQNNNHPNTKVLDLGGGLSIHKVPLGSLREQGINARYMSKKKFDTLTKNIKDRKALESLPLTTPNKDRPHEFFIISGHHRVRAAKAAGLAEIYILVDESIEDMDDVRVKQLAHNALSGEDDSSMLKQIYDQIADLEKRLQTGISDDEMILQLDPVKIKEVDLEMEFKLLQVFFLKGGKAKFDEAIRLVDEDAEIIVGDFPAHKAFTKAVKKVKNVEEIRNSGAILTKMAEIIIQYYKERTTKEG